LNPDYLVASVELILANTGDATLLSAFYPPDSAFKLDAIVADRANPLDFLITFSAIISYY
jgi:hypothetical protein